MYLRAPLRQRHRRRRALSGFFYAFTLARYLSPRASRPRQPVLPTLILLATERWLLFAPVLCALRSSTRRWKR
jgi:hypothetical protein